MTTLNLQVSASSDDGVQAQGGSVSLTDSSLLSDHTGEPIGLRFTGVTIPQGATINDARLSVFLAGTTFDEPQHQLRGELSDDADTFTTGSNDIGGRARTTAAVQWNSTDLGATDASEWQWGAPNGSPASGADISAIIQEIVDQVGWVSGNSLALIFEQHTLDTARDLAIYSYDNSPARGAKLSIDYTEPSTGNIAAKMNHYRQMRT